jgi:hypothetical protein
MASSPRRRTSPAASSPASASRMRSK